MPHTINEPQRERRRASAMTWATLSLLWKVGRFPLATLMTLLSPLITAALTACALLAFLCAFLYEFSSAGAQFSFWEMIGVSAGCVVLIGVYHAVLRLLTN